MNQQWPRIYHLDGVEIDAGQLCQRRNGEEQHLRSKTFQVLLYLLESRDRLVTKNELIERIWPDTAVTDNTLEQCLAEIRRVLGDNSRQPRFIKTIPRAGYRFIGAVDETSGEPTATADKSRPAAPLPERAQKPRTRLGLRPILIVTVVLLALAALGAWYLKRSSVERQSLVTTT